MSIIHYKTKQVAHRLSHVAIVKGPEIAAKEFKTHSVKCQLRKPDPLDKNRRTMKAENHSGQVGYEFCLSSLKAGMHWTARGCNKPLFGLFIICSKRPLFTYSLHVYFFVLPVLDAV